MLIVIGCFLLWNVLAGCAIALCMAGALADRAEGRER